jgi:hypothetical protein
VLQRDGNSTHHDEALAARQLAAYQVSPEHVTRSQSQPASAVQPRSAAGPPGLWAGPPEYGFWAAHAPSQPVPATVVWTGSGQAALRDQAHETCISAAWRPADTEQVTVAERPATRTDDLRPAHMSANAPGSLPGRQEGPRHVLNTADCGASHAPTMSEAPRPSGQDLRALTLPEAAQCGAPVQTSRPPATPPEQAHSREAHTLHQGDWSAAQGKAAGPAPGDVLRHEEWQAHERRLAALDASLVRRAEDAESRLQAAAAAASAKPVCMLQSLAIRH